MKVIIAIHKWNGKETQAHIQELELYDDNNFFSVMEVIKATGSLCIVKLNEQLPERYRIK